VEVLELLETASGLKMRVADCEDGDEEAEEQRDNLARIKKLASDPALLKTHEVKLPALRKKKSSASAADSNSKQTGIDIVRDFLDSMTLMSDLEYLKDKVCGGTRWGDLKGKACTG